MARTKKTDKDQPDEDEESSDDQVGSNIRQAAAQPQESTRILRSRFRAQSASPQKMGTSNEMYDFAMADSNYFLRARVQSIWVNDGRVDVDSVNDFGIFTRLRYWLCFDVDDLLLLPSLTISLSLSRQNRLSRLLSSLHRALFGLEVRRRINVW